MFSVRPLAAGLLLLALAPTAARADGLITPFWGANFGDAHGGGDRADRDGDGPADGT
jgi:hypothetical protein